MISEKYVQVFPLDLNIIQLRESCNLFYNHLLNTIDTTNIGIDTGPITTQAFNQYNLLLYPFAEFHKLYQEICKTFNNVCDIDDNYYIQCWLNYYEHNQYIDWHKHFDPLDNTWHGFVCVDCKDSKTSYRLPNGEELDIPSIDGNIVISKSNGDIHRTYPWPYTDSPRITIAFDIVPWHNIHWGINHWAPVRK
jgi:hypothetical protein